MDKTVGSCSYRIFTYRRVPRYQKWWHNESALECRGITFERMDGEPIRLASWPFEKFFNWNENPLTRNIDFTNLREVLVKEDGSLVSSMMLPTTNNNNNEQERQLHLKTRNSLQSDLVTVINDLIRSPPFAALYDFVFSWTQRGYTVIMEYTSPNHRIVVPYTTSKLTVLAIRSNEDGTYVDIHKSNDDFSPSPEMQPYLVKNILTEPGLTQLKTREDDILAFLENISNMKKIEGYVVRLASGQRIKIKTNWYKELHDGVNNPARPGESISEEFMVKAFLKDTMDDVRSMYHTMPEVLAKMDDVTERVSKIYNDTITPAADFYDDHKSLSRKKFTMLAQQKLTTNQNQIVTKMYVQGTTEVDISEVVLQQMKKKMPASSSS